MWLYILGRRKRWAILHEYIRMKHASTYTLHLMKVKNEGHGHAHLVTHVGNTRHVSSVLECALLLGIATSKFRFPSRNNPRYPNRDISMLSWTQLFQ
jgi:hypothetical protein